MKVIDKLKTLDSDQLANLLVREPWQKWFAKNVCTNTGCDYYPYCTSSCQLYDDDSDIIKAWLESEYEDS